MDLGKERLMLALPPHIKTRKPYKKREVQKTEQVTGVLTINEYEVDQAFQVRDRTIGIIQLQKGEILHRIVDQPEAFSNGLCILHESVITSNMNLFWGIAR